MNRRNGCMPQFSRPFYLLGFCLLVFGSATASAAPQSRVVLISIDGLMPDYYLQADALGVKIPNLRQLIKDGVHARGAVGVFPSVTFTSHTTIITGVQPRRHGVAGNRVFDPTGSAGGGWYWYYRDVRVPTLFSAARRARISTASVTWPATAGAPIDSNFPDMYPVEDLREAKNLMALAAGQGIESVVASASTLVQMHDDVRTNVALHFLKARPRLLAIHYLELDEQQHAHGPKTSPVLETLERIDGELGRLFEAVRRAGLWESTTWIVVSDHGHVAIDTTVSPCAVFEALGLLEVDNTGGITRWDAVTWGSGGATGVYINKDAPAGTRERVDGALELLGAHKFYGVERVVRGAALEQTGGFAGAYAAIEARHGVTLSHACGTRLVAPSKSKSTHGYSPEHPSLHASFIAAGPHIKRGASLGLVRLVDIAPTVARVLNLTLANTDGTAIEAAFR